MQQPPTYHRRVIPWIAVLAGLGFLAFAACQEPAGPPPMLEAGAVSFSFEGQRSGTFTADGRCYWSEGYPVADSACALAIDLGDTIRIRAVRAPRTVSWVHVNVAFPADGVCDDADACRMAYDFLRATGKVQDGFRSTEATVTILEETEDRMRGTFSGRARQVDGEAGDTIRIFDGTFDVPVER